MVADTALFHDQREDIAHRIVGQNDLRANRGFLDLDDGAGVRHVNRIIDFDQVAAVLDHMVNNTRIRRNDLHVVLATDALLDDLHVEETEEATTETKAERQRAFRSVNEGRIVQTQPPERGLQFLVVVALERIQTAKNQRAHFFVARQHVRRRPACDRDGVAGFYVSGVLDTRDDVAHIAGTQRRDLLHLGHKDAHFLNLGLLARAHQHHHIAGLDRAGKDPHVGDAAAIRVVKRIEHQRARLWIFLPAGLRHAGHDGFENIDDADA